MKKIVLLFLAFCLLSNIMAQKKIDLASLNEEQLNLYKKKATFLRNEGIGLTVVGTGVAIIGIRMLNKEDDDFNFGDELDRMGKAAFVTALGIISAGVGIPLWIAGANRKSSAEVYLIRKNTGTNNSYAVGLGLSIRF